MNRPTWVLRRWQRECLDKWIQNRGRGVAYVATGAGKTLLALAAVHALETRPELGSGAVRVRIVVPKVFLAAAWRAALTRELGVPHSEIGLCCGGAARRDAKFLIYVVNSARDRLARRILRELSAGGRVFLICDECHHCAAEANAKIFDFIPHLLGLPGRFFALGLSATPGSPAERTALVRTLGAEIYRYGPAEALRDGIMSRCRVVNIAISLTPDEREAYEEIDEQLIACLIRLKKLAPSLEGLSGRLFFDTVLRLSRSQASPKTSREAGRFLNLTYRRRAIVHTASYRIRCAAALTARLERDSRVLIFAERVDTVEAVFAVLNRLYPGRAGRFYGALGPAVKCAALEDYKSGARSLLVTCRALDEGLNIPETDTGIIVSCSSSDRQRIQRAGRVLRPAPPDSPRRDRVKTLYYFYVPETPEDAEFLPAGVPGLETLSMAFDEKTGEFVCPDYDALCAAVLEAVARKTVSPALYDELIRNLRLAGVRGDWLLPPEDCERALRAARDVAERNYWLTVRRLARERGAV
ncbi:MAG: DEAD/DEAH box helicase family protein [Oscillospiraceae bacterium]|jgi:superfamily II DNA or RNA helicase|nr:DEAD/DEAH box helicase family protein [Oscillospiraceae bacterium]